MTKLLKKEDLEEFQSNLKKRVERGKELMGGANKPMQAEPKKEKTEE